MELRKITDKKNDTITRVLAPVLGIVVIVVFTAAVIWGLLVWLR